MRPSVRPVPRQWLHSLAVDLVALGFTSLLIGRRCGEGRWIAPANCIPVADADTDDREVFDRTVALDDVPAGYRAMADRDALKVLVAP